MPPKFQPAADLLSLSCFMNAFCSEYPKLVLKEKDRLRIGPIALPLRKDSPLRRHRYEGSILRAEGTAWTEISFAEFLDEILELRTLREESDDARRGVFRQRVLASRQFIEDVFQSRWEKIRAISQGHLCFEDAEQLLIQGHLFHPTPKSRDELATMENRLFCPEFSGRFALHWFAVHPDSVVQASARSFHGRDWVAEIIAADPLLSAYAWPEGYRPYPMNPWQARFLKEKTALRELISMGRIRDLGPLGSSWYPTSSVRSLYNPSSPFMLKTSLSVRLTNSLRNLLPLEVERGMQVHDVLASSEGRAFQAEFPHCHILSEPAYYALRLGDSMLPESIVVCRSNPIPAKEEAVVLATLTQDAFGSEPSLMERQLKALSRQRDLPLQDAAMLWWDHFAELALKPLLMAQANYGFLFGAHQQNIVLGLGDGLPRRLYFRDCQGTGYSERAYEKLKGEVPLLKRENGNILDQQKAEVLFIYYLIINAAFNVISSLADASGLEERALLRRLRGFLEKIRKSETAEPHILDRILDGPELLQKANFFCALTLLNENTSPNPFALYRPISNPLTLSEVRP